MPNRIIKESIRESESIDLLSDKAEILFIRLITFADDFGLFKSDPVLVNKALFPRKDYRTNQVILWLDEVGKSGMVRFYIGPDTKPYGFFVNWGKHQQQRALKAKYPKYDDRKGELYLSLTEMMKEVERIRYQMISDDIRCSRESESESESYSIHEVCSEPSQASEPKPAGFIEIPLVTIDKITKQPKTYTVTEAQVAEWAESYPGVDVKQQLRNLRQWNIANQAKRKTGKGILKHIIGWLSKEQDRGGKGISDGGSKSFERNKTGNSRGERGAAEKYADLG